VLISDGDQAPPQEDPTMPHWSRVTAVMFAVAVSAATASMPAQGQTDPLTGNLARPDRAPPPRFQEPRRDFFPSPSPWSAVPGRAAAGPSSGVITQRQAMDRLAAAGFTDVLPPIPNRDGSWTGSAYMRGERVQATIDLQGNITAR
jgi:hypothetical protein